MSSATQGALFTKRIEFNYLDGLRGGAALLVAAYHAFLFTGRQGDAADAMPV